MSDPVTHTTAGLVAGSTSASVIGSMLGLDYFALCAAIGGAVIYRTVSPPINSYTDILRAAGMTIISTILATYGSLVIEAIALHYVPYLSSIGHVRFIILIGFIMGLIGDACVNRAFQFIANYKTSGER